MIYPAELNRPLAQSANQSIDGEEKKESPNVKI